MRSGASFQGSYVGSLSYFILMNADWNVTPIEQVQAAARGTQAVRRYPNFGNMLSHDERRTRSVMRCSSPLSGATRRACTYGKLHVVEDDRLQRGQLQTHVPGGIATAARVGTGLSSGVRAGCLPEGSQVHVS